VRLCIIGKYPPIQGGVSMRTYWSAHALAARGHEVHVVTNAREVEPPFRMHMRACDWRRCEANYPGGGSVSLHWTDPVDRSQSHIPMASPFVSKLATLAAGVHARHPFDAILSFYMEPYGIAGHLAADMTGAPHVVRMAGSDAGQLWRHPQFEALYDHVLRSAAAAIISGKIAERAVARGVDPDRIAFVGGVTVPEDLFAPGGPTLDLAALRAEVETDPALGTQWWGEVAGRPFIGVYGKLGVRKGSFALLAALRQLADAGLDVGLVALAHGAPGVEAAFRDRVRELGLADRVLQIPYLPHWRVPEFLRGCLAVCCFEQDFPIAIHSPIIPREVLLCGTCLVASTELLRKLPGYARLPDAFGCVAIEDVNRVDLVSERLAAIVRHPEDAAVVGARGRAFASALQRDADFPQALERILAAAAARRSPPGIGRGAAPEPAPEQSERFFLTRLARAAMKGAANDRPPLPLSLAQARRVQASLDRLIASGRDDLRAFAAAAAIEVAIAAAEDDGVAADGQGSDPLFRLRRRRWAPVGDDLSELVPLRDARLRILAFDFDVADFLGVRRAEDLPAAPNPRPSYIIAFARGGEAGRGPLVVDAATARILQLSDGTRSVAEILDLVEGGSRPATGDCGWIENLFLEGLISLSDARLKGAPATADIA
jgi:glycosyltransferase involved in cell wall biosynthesis